jgi:hypothetical protein
MKADPRPRRRSRRDSPHALRPTAFTSPRSQGREGSGALSGALPALSLPRRRSFFCRLAGPHSGHPRRPFAGLQQNRPFGALGGKESLLLAEPARQARRHARPVRPHAPAWRLRARPRGPNAPRSWPPARRAAGQLRGLQLRRETFAASPAWRRRHSGAVGPGPNHPGSQGAPAPPRPALPLRHGIGHEPTPVVRLFELAE